MKKLLGLCLLTFCLSPAFGAKKPVILTEGKSHRLGPKALLELVSYTGTGVFSNNENSMGFGLGTQWFLLPAVPQLSLRPDLLFHASKVEGINVVFAQLPVFAQYAFPIELGATAFNLFVAGGMEAAVRLGGFPGKHTTFAIGFGGGMEVEVFEQTHFIFDVRYYLGLTPSIRLPSTFADLKANRIHFSASLLFDV